MAISQKISSRLYLKATEDLPDVSMLTFHDRKRFVDGELHSTWNRGLTHTVHCFLVST